MPYTPILATLGYVFSADRQSVLMIHRNARPTDAHLGKFNGLGGKLEPGEDVLSGMKREIAEEAAIRCTHLQLAGTISWPGFGKNGEDWFAFLFRILAFEGTPPAKNAEGELHWIPVDQVLSLPLWSGDRFFLPRILDLSHPIFHGVMPYQNGQPVSWHFST